MTTKTKLTKAQIETLRSRRNHMLLELKTCTTTAQRRCVMESLEKVCSQLNTGRALPQVDTWR